MEKDKPAPIELSEPDKRFFSSPGFGRSLNTTVLTLKQISEDFSAVDWADDSPDRPLIEAAFRETQKHFKDDALELTSKGVQLVDRQAVDKEPIDMGTQIIGEQEHQLMTHANHYFLQCWDHLRHAGPDEGLISALSDTEAALAVEREAVSDLTTQVSSLEKSLSTAKKENRVAHWLAAKTSTITLAKIALPAALGGAVATLGWDMITTSNAEKNAKIALEDIRAEKVIDLRSRVVDVLGALGGKINDPVEIGGITFNRVNPDSVLEERKFKKPEYYDMTGKHQGYRLLFSIGQDSIIVQDFEGKKSSLQLPAELEMWVAAQKPLIEQAKQVIDTSEQAENEKVIILSKTFQKLKPLPDGTVRMHGLIFDQSNALYARENGYSKRVGFSLAVNHDGYKLIFDVYNSGKIVGRNDSISSREEIQDFTAAEDWVQRQLDLLQARKDGVEAQIKALGGKSLYELFTMKDSTIKLTAKSGHGKVKTNAHWSKDDRKFYLKKISSSGTVGVRVSEPHDFYVDGERYGTEVTEELLAAIRKL